jgi:hypothetical protein
MQFFKAQYALSVYLIFFLNFGPSFHRAPAFGLHGNELVHCSCGNHEIAKNADQPTGQITTQPCDCHLCDYFEFYNASFLISVDSVATTNHFYINQYCLTVSLTPKVIHLPRGPPSLV